MVGHGLPSFPLCEVENLGNELVLLVCEGEACMELLIVHLFFVRLATPLPYAVVLKMQKLGTYALLSVNSTPKRRILLREVS